MIPVQAGKWTRLEKTPDRKKDFRPFYLFCMQLFVQLHAARLPYVCVLQCSFHENFTVFYYSSVGDLTTAPIITDLDSGWQGSNDAERTELSKLLMD